MMMSQSMYSQRNSSERESGPGHRATSVHGLDKSGTEEGKVLDALWIGVQTILFIITEKLLQGISSQNVISQREGKTDISNILWYLFSRSLLIQKLQEKGEKIKIFFKG